MNLEAAASACHGKVSAIAISSEGGSSPLWSLASSSSCSFSRSKVASGNSIARAAFSAARPPSSSLPSKKSPWPRLCTAAGEDGAMASSDDVDVDVDADARQSAIEIAEALVADKPIAPLEPDSPAGQFLMQTLKGNPHLFHAAAEQQLQQLESERKSSLEQQFSSASPEHILYKRIAQLKSEERRRAVQEVIYVLVVERFLKAGIKMVPKISALLTKDGSSRLWAIQEKDLEGVHTPEALEMIKEHMEMVLGGQATLSCVEPQTVAQISKLRVGQIYATSVMYGYFLKRVDERYQLEKKMKIPTTGSGRGVVTQFLSLEKRLPTTIGENELDIASSPSSPSRALALKTNDLRAYVARFDNETLSRYATMRTHETVDLIERHAEALFGRPDLKVGPDGSVGLARDDAIQIRFASLRALVMEAAAFGSYLWEVESYVDLHYRVVPRAS